MDTVKGQKIMNTRNKRQQENRGKQQRTSKGKPNNNYGGLDPYEVHEYEQGRLRQGEKFGKKWFPENKGE